MPIYEYRCEACGHTLDALQKVSDAPLADCPECGKATLKRLISAPAFRLKGGGWYETDFKSDKEKKRNIAESGTAAEAKPKDSDKSKDGDKPKSDAKPEKKDEAKPKKTGGGSEAA